MYFVGNILALLILCFYLHVSKLFQEKMKSSFYEKSHLRKNESSSSHDWTHKTMYWSAFALSRAILPRAAPPSRLQSGMMTFQTQCSGCPEFPSVHLGDSDVFLFLSLFSCVSEVHPLVHSWEKTQGRKIIWLLPIWIATFLRMEF